MLLTHLGPLQETFSTSRYAHPCKCWEINIPPNGSLSGIFPDHPPRPVATPFPRSSAPFHGQGGSSSSTHSSSNPSFHSATGQSVPICSDREDFALGEESSDMPPLEEQTDSSESDCNPFNVGEELREGFSRSGVRTDCL
jgi:hypothetical protein